MSITNIGKLQENFAAVQDGCEISQHKGHHFVAKGWFHSPAKLAFSLKWSASNGCNSFISTPNSTPFESLDWWLPSFETTYSMHNLSSRKCSKSGWQLLSSRMLHGRFFSFLPFLAFMICLWKRALKLQSFGSSCFWAFHCFAMDSKELFSISDCFGDQITNKNTKTYTIWLEIIAKVLNMLIELKGNNYYSKVFKRVNYKLSNKTFWVVIMAPP